MERIQFRFLIILVTVEVTLLLPVAVTCVASTVTNVTKN